MGFSRQEHWSGWLSSPPGDLPVPLNYTLHEILQARIGGCPFPSPGDFANPGIEPRSPALQADSLPADSRGKPGGKSRSNEIFTPPPLSPSSTEGSGFLAVIWFNINHSSPAYCLPVGAMVSILSKVDRFPMTGHLKWY